MTQTQEDFATPTSEETIQRVAERMRERNSAFREEKKWWLVTRYDDVVKPILTTNITL